MIKEAKIKQAYAVGASAALQQLGFEKSAADEMGEKLAQEPDTGQRILTALGGPMYAGLSAPEGKGWNVYGHTAGKGGLGGLIGGLGGGLGGAGIGALVSALSRGRVPLEAGLGGGAMGGGILGALTGQQIGLQKGLTSGYAS